MHILVGYGYDPVTTGRYVEEAFSQRCDVSFVGCSDGSRPGFAPNLDLERYIAQTGAKPDLFVYVDSGHIPYLPYHLEHLQCPTAAYLIDVHVGSRLRLPLAALFDYVFVAQRDSVQEYSADPGQVVEWLPLACDPSLYTGAPHSRIWDIGFVGNPGTPQSRRFQLLSMLQTEFLMNDFHRPYSREEMAETYMRSKIVVNCSVGSEVNMRLFEALASGALLITDRIENGLSELFSDGLELITYDGPQDLREKVRYYLAHDAERDKIAIAGKNKAFSAHTWSSRVQQLLDTVETRRPGARAPARNESEAIILRRYADLYSRFRLIDPTMDVLRVARSHRQSRLYAVSRVAQAILRRVKHG